MVSSSSSVAMVIGPIVEYAIAPIIVVGVDSTRHRDYEYSAYPSPITDLEAPEPIGKQLAHFFAMKPFRLCRRAIV